jgi:hypothetical protein
VSVNAITQYVHFGQDYVRNQSDYKAISQNVMHSTMGIIDRFYSNVDDLEKRNRIDSMFNNKCDGEVVQQEYKYFLDYMAWKQSKEFDNN